MSNAKQNKKDSRDTRDKGNLSWDETVVMEWNCKKKTEADYWRKYTIFANFPKNLSALVDHFVGLVLKGLTDFIENKVSVKYGLRKNWESDIIGITYYILSHRIPRIYTYRITYLTVIFWGW